MSLICCFQVMGEIEIFHSTFPVICLYETELAGHCRVVCRARSFSSE